MQFRTSPWRIQFFENIFSDTYDIDIRDCEYEGGEIKKKTPPPFHPTSPLQSLKMQIFGKNISNSYDIDIRDCRVGEG